MNKNNFQRHLLNNSLKNIIIEEKKSEIDNQLIDYNNIFNNDLTMIVYFNGMWNDFENDSKYSDVFIKLLQNVFNCNISIGDFDSAEILFESIFSKSMIDLKEWKYSFFYSGEPQYNEPSNLLNLNYNVILRGERSYKNIVHFPFFAYYLAFDSIDLRLKDLEVREIGVRKLEIPKKFCCSVITNENGLVRNKFIEKLEKYKEIHHFGKYKNNQVEVLPGNWHSPELIQKMSEYKFVICFENSEYDAYITEKIINPLLANTIPIYWGNSRIGDYFNSDRILHLPKEDENSMDILISKIIGIDRDDNKYLRVVNESYHTVLNVCVNLKSIGKDIQRVLFNKYEKLQKVVCIVDDTKESSRYIKLRSELYRNGFHDSLIEYSLPTYHDNIEEKLFSRIKIDHSKYLKSNNKKLSLREISLFLNFYIIFKRILASYKCGLFMILESDVIFKSKYSLIKELLNKINIDYHHCVSFGSGCDMEVTGKKVANNNIELFKYNTTRCTDSFIFSYDGIKLLVEYIEKKIYNEKGGIDNPIDFFMNEFLATNTYNFYWTLPSLTFQGSQKGIFNSTIQ